MSSPPLPPFDASQSPPQSSSSDCNSSPAPTFVSKTFSNRCSASTYASSPAPRDSFEFFGSGKGSLSKVREEGSSPRQEELDPLSSPIYQGGRDTDQSALYNFDDGFTQPPAELYPIAKRPRSNDSPMLRSAPSMSKRIGSLSNKWKARTGAGPKLSIDVAASDAVRSRNGSSASSVISPIMGHISQQNSNLPSPARTVFEESIKEASVAPIDIEKANSQPEEESAQATTPLLPPMLMALAAERAVQSPLQSPTIADGFFTESTTPVDTPRMTSLPSPPLSTKPSIASIRQRSRAGTMVGSAIVPPTDIPPMIMDTDDDDDSWATKLGHADFTILPEPYLPGLLDLETCKIFRQDHDEAKANFKTHLTHTADNFGIKSRIFKLTEEKWAEIDAEWQQCNAMVAEAVERLAREQDAIAANNAQSNSDSVPRPQIPATDIFAGKFPNLDDEEIVGPMSVAPALKKLITHESSLRMARKRNFFKFFSDLLTRGTVRA